MQPPADVPAADDTPPDAPPPAGTEQARRTTTTRRRTPAQRPAPPVESPTGRARRTGPGDHDDGDPGDRERPSDRADPGDGGADASRAVVDRPAAAALTERELAMLAFERQWWRHAGAKEQAIRDTFDISATRYYQLLNGLLDNPAALAAEPMLVARLRRLRAARARGRRR